MGFALWVEKVLLGEAYQSNQVFRFTHVRRTVDHLASDKADLFSYLNKRILMPCPQNEF